MKLAVPENADRYFAKTDHAVKHAYAGLASCWQHVEEARRHERPPVLKDGMLHYLPPQTPEERAALDRSLAAYHRYFALKVSEAIFAGTVLETAYMAIRLFSRNTSIPASCASFVKADQSTALPFCIGKERHGIPIGLIIFAGRNQYAHWDEEDLKPVNRAVFAALDDAFSDKPFSDLAFDLGNPTIPIYAWEILFTALGWTSYERYLAEMEELLRASPGPERPTS